jgi:hypothetical protein
MARNAYRWAAAVPASLLVWAAATTGNHAAAQAAGIGWEKQGAFQTCLDGATKTWLDAKVELVVNEDPAVSEMTDASVAAWAADALKNCAAKAGGGDAASEQQFMRYMAHWRDHIFKAADEIRRRGRPD